MNRLNITFNNIAIFLFSMLTSYNFAIQDWNMFALNLFGLVVNVMIRYAILEDRRD